jgi:Rod binding domain-containing protein
MKVNSPSQKISVSESQKQMLKQLKDVANGMEEQFASLLIQEMKKSIDKTEDGSTAMKIYESMLDQEYARILADQGQLGLSDVIVKQLAPKMNIDISNDQRPVSGSPGDHNDSN